MHQLGFSGNDDDLVDAEQVIKLLGLQTREALNKLIEEGEFPPAFRTSPRKKDYWLRADAVAYLHLLVRIGPKKSAGDEE